MAHEISHVALRHSTNQASKAMLAQAQLAVLGGIFSGGGIGGQIAQLGVGFGLQSAFLKFSRSAERQADEQGAQMLYDAGYEPKAMADFFATLQASSGGGGVEFFSSHPNPGNRQRDVAALIPRLGPSKNFTTGADEFYRMKRRIEGLGGILLSRATRPRRRAAAQARRAFTPHNAIPLRVVPDRLSGQLAGPRRGLFHGYAGPAGGDRAKRRNPRLRPWLTAR